jgi:glycogen debranching enzyme
MAQVETVPDAARLIEVPQPQIVVATDLGSVMVLKHANLYLLSDQFGDVHADSRGLGLYDEDTRILSCGVLRVNGRRPSLLQSSTGGNFRSSIQMTNPDPLRDIGQKIDPNESLAHRSLGIRRERLLAGALQERIRIVNYTERPVTVDIDLDLASDSADIFEVRGYRRPRRGTLLQVLLTDTRVTFRYDGLDGRQRRTYVAFSVPGELGPIDPDGRDGHVPSATVHGRWSWLLPARGHRELEWTVWGTRTATPAPTRSRAPSAVPTDGPETRARRPDRAEAAILLPPPPHLSPDEGVEAYQSWTRGTSSVETDNDIFNLTIQRSMGDLRLLLNDGPGPGERYVAAGVPWFTTLFGRDSIITALQALAFRPQIAIETLAILAERQATERDDWRDAEPGKILHELRTGEMAAAHELPHTPYFGSVDSTPLWLILLGATFDWTGDRALLDRYWPNVLAALAWIDRYGDRDGDGFVEYARRSERGLYNQGWKDSRDAIRDRRGGEAVPPIALVEVQGYVYDAKRRIAKLARVRGDEAHAARLEAEAEALRARFEEAYWVPDQSYYAMALDADKAQADGIASNPGHCLWSGVVLPERARHVADRILEPGLFSGWGVRTYAGGQSGFNPIGYHTGAVWPHDTSLIAAGLKRYGFHDEANLLVGRIFEAAQHFPDFRLPELFCGFDREGGSGPVPYPVACSPQAWAAGASFLFLETMLGLRAHADRAELELWRPHLPEWLGKVSITNLRVGEASVDLLFHSWRGTTSAEVLRKVGDISVTIRL